MSLEQNNPGNDLLERAVSVLRDANVPNGPPPDVVEQTLVKLGVGMESNPTRTKWRATPMKFRSTLAVAAALVIVFGSLSFWGLHPRGSVAFGEVLKNVQSVLSVQFKGTATVQIPSLGSRTVTTETIIVEPGRVRQTILPSEGMPGGMVMIQDYGQGRCLSLDPVNKRATIMEMSNVPSEQKSQNLLEQFRQFNEKAATPIGEKEIAGRRAQGFKVGAPTMEMLIWADMETRLPVEIEVTMKSGLLPPTTMIMTEFVWGEPVDESLVSLTPPEGYESQTIKMNLGPATEQDVIEGLRTVAELNGGQFPPGLDLMSAMSALKGLGKQLKSLNEHDPAQRKEGETKIAQATSRLTTAIGRAWMFINDPKNGDDFHYAGKGVKSAQAGTPILWYRPKDSETYRVIDADLTVHDVAPTDLPGVPSVLLKSTTKPTEAQPPQQ
jgi:hypothetical protein